MESELKAVIKHLVENRWPFRLHATYNETIERALNVHEEVNREIPIDGLHWFFDHCETISDRNIERVKALGGSIAVQNRMASKASILSNDAGRCKPNVHHPFGECSRSAFRFRLAQTQGASQATTLTFPFIGLSLARP